MRLTPIMDNHGHQRKTYNKKWHPKSSSPLETTKWMKDIEFHNRNPFVHIYIYHSVPSNGETIKNRAAKLHNNSIMQKLFGLFDGYLDLLYQQGYSVVFFPVKKASK